MEKINLRKIIFIILMFLIAGCGKEITLNEADIPLTDYSSLELTSNPTGAKIYINGKNSGYTTPCNIKWVEQGNVALTFKLPLYYDGVVQLSTQNTETVSYFYDYNADSRNFGTIYCNSTPGNAEIYLNGTLLNKKTPYFIRGLRPGNYKVKYKFPKFRSDSLFAEVHAQQNSNDYTTADIPLIDTTKFVDYTRETNSFYANCVIADKQNRIWYGTPFEGVFVYDRNTFTHITYNNSPLPTNTINYLFPDSKGNTWISTSGGLAKLSSGGVWEIFNVNNSPIPVNVVNSLSEDSNENIWMATKKGLVKYKNGIWEVYTHLNSQLPLDDISYAACSQDNAIWMAIYNYGVMKYSNGEWTGFTPSNSNLTDKYLIRIKCAGNNTVYAASENSVAQYSGGAWKTITLLNRPITGIFVDSDNNLWTSMRSGLTIYKTAGPAETYRFSEVTSLGKANNQDITQSSDKLIWLATYDRGLIKFKYFK